MKYLWRSLIIALVSLGLSLLFHNLVTSQGIVDDRTIENATPINIVQIAQQNYQIGNFEKSIELLQQAASIYQTQQKTLQQAQVLSLLSLAQQKLGKWEEARQTLKSSQALLSVAPDNQEKQQVLAQIENTKGHWALGTGQTKQALNVWKQAEQLYNQIGDRQGVQGSLINQAQALEELGFYHRSCDLVLGVLTEKDNRCEQLKEKQLAALLLNIQTTTKPWQIDGLCSLSNTLILIGQLEQAQAILEATYSLNQKLGQGNKASLVNKKILLSLGNIYRDLALREFEQENVSSAGAFAQKAMKFYQSLEEQQEPNSSLLLYQIQGELNKLALLIKLEKWSETEELVKQVDRNRHQLTLNHYSVYAQINFAHSLTFLKQKPIKVNYSWLDIADLLTNAIANAHNLEDKRAEAYALGYLGQLDYEQKLVSTAQAQNQLEKALNIAQAINAPEIAYRWQWQLGKIYRDRGDLVNANLAYQAAFNTLKDLRSDLAVLNQEIQFSFREQVESVYREFAELLLVQSSSSGQNNEENLQMARDVIEGLQIAELDNYFQDACLTFKKQNIEQIDSTAAVIYTIVLSEHLEVILALPGGKLSHYNNLVSQVELEQTVEQLRRYIKEPDRLRDVQLLTNKIYGWLIEPFRQDLAEQQQIQTLVFVLDGVLQNIPMAVLYDGENYLLEKYAIALTPGLRLINPEKESINHIALGGGVSQTRQIQDRQFTPLENVQTELSSMQSLVKGKTLLNDQFTQGNLVSQLNENPFSIVHLATHGQFSSDPNNTFILLWDRLMNIKDFSNILHNRNQARSRPIDLLVLSACETATGDKRATLGLAGMAVRTGARSTLATLWQINDESTSTLMSKFYRYIENNKNYNKAEALRLAQLELWQNQERDWQIPAFWAAYVLIGNWQ